MPLEVLKDTKVDGVIVIFRSFRALKFCSNFMLPGNVSIQRVQNTYYRSSTIFSNYKKLIKISFGYHNDMPLDIVVAFRKANFNQIVGIDEIVDSDDETDRTGGQDECGRVNDFKIVRNCFISSVNHSIIEVGCWAYRCCKTYEDIIKRKGCGCFNTRYIECCNDSATKFGDIFLDHFQSLVRRRFCDDIDVVFTCRDVGQNIPYDDAQLSLYKFHPEHVKELLIHCARDYWIPGYAIFWDSKKIKNILGTPKMEFYPGLIKGNGNLYFEEKHNENAEIEVKMRKYYSQLFKELDNVGARKVSPFSQALLKHYLCEDPNKKINYPQWISSVLGVLDTYKNANTKYLYCRQELICSCLKLSSLGLSDVLRKVKKKLSLNNIQKSCNFRTTKLNDFLQYLEKFMKPLLHCVANEVVRKIQCEENEDFYFIKDDQLRLVCACEAIIGFTIYGTAEWRKNQEMFPKVIRDELGLSVKHFKHIGSHGSTLRVRCVGINGLKKMTISGYVVTCTAKFPLDRVYSIYLSNDSRNKLFECLDQCHGTNVNHIVLKQVCEILLQAIFLFSQVKNECQDADSWERVKNICLRKHLVTPVTPQEYCEFLFNNTSVFYKQVLQLVHQCKFAFSKEMFRKFQIELCNVIEEQILCNSCMFTVPERKYFNFAILPLLPLRSISNIGTQQNALMVDLKRLFDNIYRIKVSDLNFYSIVHATLLSNEVVLMQSLETFLDNVAEKL